MSTRTKISKGGETRARLIEAALDLFHRKGVQWVSFQMIAEKVGLRQASLYAYFEDKDDLLLACCRDVNERARAFIDARIPADLPMPAPLQAYVYANLAWVEECPSAASILMAMYYFSCASAPLAEVRRQLEDLGTARIRTHLLQGAREHAWRDQIEAKDAETIARIIQSYLTGEVIKTLHRPREMSSRKRGEMVWNGVLTILGGLRNPIQAHLPKRR